MWVFQIFTIVWDNLFTLPIGFGNLTFGGLLLGVFIVGFLASTVYKFMHRGDKE